MFANTKKFAEQVMVEVEKLGITGSILENSCETCHRQDGYKINIYGLISDSYGQNLDVTGYIKIQKCKNQECKVSQMFDNLTIICYFKDKVLEDKIQKYIDRKIKRHPFNPVKPEMIVNFIQSLGSNCSD